MLQPFEPFKLIYISKLRELKKRYLVSQTYNRAYDHFADIHKTDILLTDYDALGDANIHLNAVKHDKYAAILDLEKEVHRNKLAAMLLESSQYKVFWAVVHSKKELKERIDKRYKENMRRWIERKTRWRIGGGETIYPDIDIAFGELFITFKYAGQSIRVKFDEIEKS